ncbi:ANTAR domain-containing protein [Streptomyces sp. NPDC059072]|uniref:ANTAR domain-containing protein n=1 Tax=Streptomyces sp. NPDC059072 TaxID=3346715 RepID=UPI00369C8C75
MRQTWTWTGAPTRERPQRTGPRRGDAPASPQRHVSTGARSRSICRGWRAGNGYGRVGAEIDDEGSVGGQLLPSERDRSFAFPAADAITTALLALEAQQSPGEAAWLDAAERDHEEVHQATGMIMVFLDLDGPQALARLRAHAFAQGQSVTEAARDVLAGRVRFDD